MIPLTFEISRIAKFIEIAEWYLPRPIKKTKIMVSGPVTSWQIEGEEEESVTDFIFWDPKSLQMVTAAMKLKDTCYLEGKLRQT